MKCANKYCNNQVEEGMGNLCLKCDDLMFEAQQSAKDYDNGEEPIEYE